MRPKKALREVLTNWRTVIASISSLTEEEAKWCLDTELAGACRKNIVERLYGRYNRARTERELLGYMRAIYEKQKSVVES